MDRWKLELAIVIISFGIFVGYHLWLFVIHDKVHPGRLHSAWAMGRKVRRRKGRPPAAAATASSRRGQSTARLPRALDCFLPARPASPPSPARCPAARAMVDAPSKASDQRARARLHLDMLKTFADHQKQTKNTPTPKLATGKTTDETPPPSFPKARAVACMTWASREQDVVTGIQAIRNSLTGITFMSALTGILATLIVPVGCGRRRRRGQACRRRSGAAARERGRSEGAAAAARANALLMTPLPREGEIREGSGGTRAPRRAPGVGVTDGAP
jgi:hypothetical protein